MKRLFVFVLIICIGSTAACSNSKHEKDVISVFENYILIDTWYYPFGGSGTFRDRLKEDITFELYENRGEAREYLVKIINQDECYIINSIYEIESSLISEVDYEDFKKVSKFQVTIEEKKPHYDYSSIEKKILEETRDFIYNDVCEFSTNETEWKKGLIYFWDFELEDAGISTWIYLENGKIISYPVFFEVSNDEIKIIRGMSDEYPSLEVFDEESVELERINAQAQLIVQFDVENGFDEVKH